MNEAVDSVRSAVRKTFIGYMYVSTDSILVTGFEIRIKLANFA